MDVIILCGGKGTRLSEETIKKTKPMVKTKRSLNLSTSAAIIISETLRQTL